MRAKKSLEMTRRYFQFQIPGVLRGSVNLGALCPTPLALMTEGLTQTMKNVTMKT